MGIGSFEGRGSRRRRWIDDEVEKIEKIFPGDGITDKKSGKRMYYYYYMRSLLLLPPSCSTPWEAIEATIATIHNYSSISMQNEDTKTTTTTTTKNTSLIDLGGSSPEAIADRRRFFMDVKRFLSSICANVVAMTLPVPPDDNDMGRRRRSVDEMTIVQNDKTLEAQWEAVQALCHILMKACCRKRKPININISGSSPRSIHREEDIDKGAGEALKSLLPSLLHASERIECRIKRIKARSSGGCCILENDQGQGGSLSFPGTLLNIIYRIGDASTRSDTPSHCLDLSSTMIHPSALVYLLESAKEIGWKYMKSQHWSKLYHLISDNLIEISHPHVVTILGLIFAHIAISYQDDIEHDDSFHMTTWLELIAIIYYITSQSQDREYFWRIEEVLCRSFTNLPQGILLIFTRILSFDDQGTDQKGQSDHQRQKAELYPWWVRANLLLLISHSNGSMRSIYDKVIATSAGPKNSAARGIQREVAKSILTIILYQHPPAEANESLPNHEKNMMKYYVNKISKELNKAPSDTFQPKFLQKLFTSVILLVRDSISLGSNQEDVNNRTCDNHPSWSWNYGDYWNDVAHYLLSWPTSSESSKHGAAAGAIIFTLFIQDPLSGRRMTEQLLSKIYQNQMDENHVQNLCWVLNMIGQYIAAIYSDEDITDHIHGDLDENLPSDFVELVLNSLRTQKRDPIERCTTLELIESISYSLQGKDALMTFACEEIKEKNNNFSYSSNIGKRTSIAVDIHFVLLGNASICSTFDETQPQCHHALKSISFLTDVITNGSKVGIVDRSRILRKIIRLHRKQKIHPWVSERILASCLGIYLTFFRAKNEASPKSYFSSSIQFLPGQSITDEGSLCEDIPLLSELVTTVFKECELNHTGRKFLFGVCRGEDTLMDMDLENNFNPQNLSLVCFKAMISFLYKEKHSVAGDKDLKSTKIKSCSELLNLLKEYEKNKWTRANIRKPKWLKKSDEELSEQRLRTRTMDQSIKTSISVALIQALPIPAMVRLERVNRNKFIIYYRSVISLLGNSWVSDSSHNELEKDYPCRCTVEARLLSAVTFFNVMATCFPKIANGISADVHETSNFCDLLFSSAEHSCTIVQECLLRDRMSVSKKSSVLHALGEFYLSICSAKGSQRILRSASHSRDCEAIIRNIRQVVLCTINCLITGKIHDATYSEDANFYIDIFHQLCTDLNSGLRGMSGGITESLCCSYIDAVLSIFEKISEGKQGKLTLLDSESVDYRQLEIKCDQISKASLQSIITCSVSASLKRLLSFILLDIPQFRRDIRLKMIANIDFEKNALKCKAVEYDPLLKTAIDWSMSIIKECSAPSKKPIDIKNNTEKLGSSEYVLATCFLGVERPWVEFSQLATVPGQKMIPLSLAKAYACHYLSELQGSLIAVFSVFDPVDAEPPLALQLLSQSTKCRISKCIEQILSTLKNSISCLLKYYEGLRRGDVSKDTMYCDYDIVKALTCFLVWIQFTVKPNHSTAHDNIAASIKLWKEQENAAQIPKNQVSKSLSRVMKRLEEVHKLVLKFQQFLNRNCSNSKRNANTQFATLVDAISPPEQDIQEEENSLDFKQKIDVYVTKYELLPPPPSSSPDDVLVSSEINKETRSLKSSQEESPRKGTSPRPRPRYPKKRGRSSDKSPKRSQNDGVDEWLRLDHQGNNDNFEDLEDFLIPG